jgi:hypothetical protein
MPQPTHWRGAGRTLAGVSAFNKKKFDSAMRNRWMLRCGKISQYKRVNFKLR